MRHAASPDAAMPTSVCQRGDAIAADAADARRDAAALFRASLMLAFDDAAAFH